MNDVLLEKIILAGSVFLLLHVLTLILCLTGLFLERVMRRGNPLVRSTLLRLNLLIALAVPVMCLIWSAVPAALPTLSQSVQPKTEPVSAQQILAKSSAMDWDHVAVWRPMITDVGQLQDRLLASTSFGPPLKEIFYAALLAISSLLSFYLLVRLVLAVFRCSALHRRGKALDVIDEAACRIIASAMGVAAPQVLKVDGLEGPLLIGFFEPAILLPEGVQARDEIYRHELTHLERHDMWWHLFARVATMLMPLQPGFWLLRSALERADEDVCDDMVLIHGGERSTYAEMLLDVAESQHAPSPDLCLPMAAFRSQLEHRLHRLMDTARPLADRISISSLSLCLGPLLVVGILTGAIYLDAERPLLAADVKPANIITAEDAKKQGIAAVVNQHTITWVTIDQQTSATEKALKQQYTGNALNEKILDAQRNVMANLVDRELIIEDFKAKGGSIPRSYTDARIDDIVKDQYGGDRAAFLKAIAERHMTLERCEKDIEDNAIVGYSRNKNVAQKVKEYYLTHPELFPQDERLNVTFVQLRGTQAVPASDESNQAPDKDPRAELAHQILIQMQAGADVSEVAKKYPVDKDFDGKPFWIAKDAPAGWPSWWPFSWDEVEKLKPGQTTNVVTGYGDFAQDNGPSQRYRYYYILRLNERLPAQIASTNQTTGQKGELIEAESKLLQEEWLAPLRAKAKIQFFW